MRRRLVLVVLAGALMSGCGGPDDDPAHDIGDGRLAMVSGRDDHGLVALDLVPLYDEPNGEHVVGRVHDGTLVRVVQREGTAMRVTTLEGETTTGWTDDYYLRGQLRLVGAAPGCDSRIGRSQVLGGTLVHVYDVSGGQVLVETVTRPGGSPVRGHALREHLQELSPQGQACGADPAGSTHVH